MIKLSGPMVPPRDGGVPKQAVVLLHGYGSDGADLIGLVPYWRDLLPDALWVSPNAPEPCRDNPGGYQWFPIDPSLVVRAEGAAMARPILVAFLADLWAQTGVTAGNTLLVGFSQGAMMALHVGLSLTKPPMGIVAFSGALIEPPDFAERHGPKPPICLVHGDDDSVVDPGFSAGAADALRAKGFIVSYQAEPGVGHSITEDGLRFAGDFISAVARGGDAAQRTTKQ